MSKTIWKYKLPVDGHTIVISEYVRQVLHIGTQGGVPTLWAIVDPDYAWEGYTEIVAWGTGWTLPGDVYAECDYLGTCEDGMGYVWHYFAATRFPERTNQFENDQNTLNTLSEINGYLNGTQTFTVSTPSITLQSDINGTIDIDYEYLRKLLNTSNVGCSDTASYAILS